MKIPPISNLFLFLSVALVDDTKHKSWKKIIGLESKANIVIWIDCFAPTSLGKHCILSLSFFLYTLALIHKENKNPVRIAIHKFPPKKLNSTDVQRILSTVTRILTCSWVGLTLIFTSYPQILLPNVTLYL